MIGLYNQIVGTCHHLFQLVRNMSHIGHYAKHDAIMLHLIAHIVGAIVGHMPCCNSKLTDLKFLACFYIMLVLCCNLLLHTVIAIYARMNILGRIDIKLIIVTEASHRLNVVCVVVSNKNIMNLAHGQSILVKIFFKRTNSHTGINKHCVGLCINKIAVTTATAS